MPLSSDLNGFASIWQDMLGCAETLPAWQPGDSNYYCRAEGLAVHLMGLSQIGISILGDAKYINLIGTMAVAFDGWAGRWLKHGSAAGWFAYFLRTESGQVLLRQGVKRLAAAAASLPDREWQHHDLGPLFTEVLSLCWKHNQKDVEKDATLRDAFLGLLTVLCARQIPEALHLRSKVSEILGAS